MALRAPPELYTLADWSSSDGWASYAGSPKANYLSTTSLIPFAAGPMVDLEAELWVANLHRGEPTNISLAMYEWQPAALQDLSRSIAALPWYDAQLRRH